MSNGELLQRESFQTLDKLCSTISGNVVCLLKKQISNCLLELYPRPLFWTALEFYTNFHILLNITNFQVKRVKIAIRWQQKCNFQPVCIYCWTNQWHLGSCLAIEGLLHANMTRRWYEANSVSSISVILMPLYRSHNNRQLRDDRKWRREMQQISLVNVLTPKPLWRLGACYHWPVFMLPDYWT